MFIDYRSTLKLTALLCAGIPSFVDANPIRFTYEAFKNPEIVGALCECSSYSAQELIRYMQKIPTGKRIVELGAGVGSVSEVIVDNMSPDDHLVLIEINEEFAAILRKKFPKSDYPHVDVLCMDLLDYQAPELFDICICTIPFNSFSCESAKKISSKMISLINPGGFISRVQYIVLPFVNRYLLKWGERRRDFKCLLEHMESLDERYEIKRVTVLRNMPPLQVHHWQVN